MTQSLSIFIVFLGVCALAVVLRLTPENEDGPRIPGARGWWIHTTNALMLDPVNLLAHLGSIRADLMQTIMCGGYSCSSEVVPVVGTTHLLIEADMPPSVCIVGSQCYQLCWPLTYAPLVEGDPNQQEGLSIHVDHRTGGLDERLGIVFGRVLDLGADHPEAETVSCRFTRARSYPWAYTRVDAPDMLQYVRTQVVAGHTSTCYFTAPEMGIKRRA